MIRVILGVKASFGLHALVLVLGRSVKRSYRGLLRGIYGGNGTGASSTGLK